MKKKIVLHDDVTMGLDYPPTHTIASSSVTINGIAICVDDDICKSHGGHIPRIIATSAVTINGKKIVVDEDPTNCGDKVVASSDVTIE